MRRNALTSWLAAVCILSFFVSFHSPQQPIHCVASTGDNLLVVGGVCTAELLQVATIWNYSDDQVATTSRLFFVLVGLLALSILPVTRALVTNVTTRFAHRFRELTISRAGPWPQSLFLPNLFATHGI